MMGVLQISLDKYLMKGQAFAKAEIAAANGVVVRRVVIPTNAPGVEVQLPAGAYLVRAWLPSGDSVSQSIELGEDSLPVLLDMGHSRHEWLSWHHFVAGLGGDEGGNVPNIDPRSAGAADHGLRPPVLYFNTTNDTRDVSLQSYSVFQREGLGTIEVEINRDLFAATVSLTIQPSVDPRQGWPRVFTALGFRDEAPSIVAIPAPWPDRQGAGAFAIDIMLQPRDPEDEEPGSIVSLTVRDPTYAAVLGYLMIGDNESARMTNEQEAVAQQMLWDKLQSPYAAAAAGYVLLRTIREGRPQEWGGWMRNLSNWFQWLPDGAIIYGSYLLATERRGERLALPFFLDALRRGVPAFTEGVRLLHRGLSRIVQREERYPGVFVQQDAEFALDAARRLATVVDPRMPFTTISEADFRTDLSPSADAGKVFIPTGSIEWHPGQMTEPTTAQDAWT